jgi:hypothetical protein
MMVRAFHRGALGDSVLLWPRLRWWAAQGSVVELITDGEKAALAARELGIAGVDAEQPRFNDLWREDAEIQPMPGGGLVVDHTGGGPVFGVNLGRLYPGATIQREPPPRGGRSAREWAAAHLGSSPALRPNSAGPTVMHVGAGGRAKRWPLDRWLALASAARGPVRLLAGPVEREKLDAAERATFARAGGEFVGDVRALADALRSARAFVGCDSGPVHLAAQLGIPALALFGPTDPELWAPVGPRVRVLAPDSPREMSWLTVAEVMAALADDQ